MQACILKNRHKHPFIDGFYMYGEIILYPQIHYASLYQKSEMTPKP